MGERRKAPQDGEIFENGLKNQNPKIQKWVKFKRPEE